MLEQERLGGSFDELEITDHRGHPPHHDCGGHWTHLLAALVSSWEGRRGRGARKPQWERGAHLLNLAVSCVFGRGEGDGEWGRE